MEIDSGVLQRFSTNKVVSSHQCPQSFSWLF